MRGTVIVPTILRVNGYRFFFYAYDCIEPRHIHMKKENAECKFWLDPVSLEFNHGMTAKQLREVERIIIDNLDTLRREWDFFCNGTIPQ